MAAGMAAPNDWPGCWRSRRLTIFSPSGAAVAQRLQVVLAAQAFADRHVFHFRRDDAAARVVHLRNVCAGLCAARGALQVKAHCRQLGIGQARLAVVAGRAGQPLRVAAFLDPRAAQFRQAAADVDLDVRVRVGTATVVHRQRRIFFAAEHRRCVVLFDLPEGDPDVRA